jgi:hypothetical protein
VALLAALAKTGPSELSLRNGPLGKVGNSKYFGANNAIFLTSKVKHFLISYRGVRIGFR